MTGHSIQCHGLVDKVMISQKDGLDDLGSLFQPI